MTLDALLAVVQTGLLLLNWPVGVILVRAAVKKPYEWSLTLMALVTVSIAVVVTVFLLAVGNAAAGYPISQEDVRIVLRLVLLGLGVIPLLFLWIYWTGRFGPGTGA